MRLDPSETRNDITRLFGEMTVEKAWLMVKIIKHCRLRCRNNAALNNFMNQLLPNLRFEQVTKYKKTGEAYPGLKISDRVTGNTHEADDDD